MPAAIRSALLCCCLGILIGVLIARPSRAAAGDPESTGFVQVPGGNLSYEVQGDGPPLILLHDGLLPSATWDGQLAAFAKTFRVIRYDRRGYGKSAPPAGKGSWSDVDDLAAVFAALHVERAVLAGCSNGSALAVDFTLAHPERVEALVLVGPVVSGLALSEHFTRRGIVDFLPLYRDKSLEKAIDNWVADRWLTDAGSTAAKETLRTLLTAHPAPVRGIPEAKAPDRPAAGRLGEIHVPVLIVVGASDIPDIHAHSGVLEAGIHGARRVVLPGAGHLVHLEKPDEFNRLVFEFLRPADTARAQLEAYRGDHTFEQSRDLFAYGTGSLDVTETATEDRGGVKVIDLHYASPLGGRVPAYLILPPGGGKHPGVVFLHPGQGDRSTFVDEAVGLARRGIVSLTIGAPFTRPEFKQRERTVFAPEVDLQDQLQAVLDLRAAFDLLAGRPEVDAARLAYVGHSFGATVGGTLAGVDRRPIAFVLMAGYPALSRAYRHGSSSTALVFQEFLTPEQQDAYAKALDPLDAVHWIGHAAPAKLLFQWARRDEYISPVDAALYLQAASSPKEEKWYDTDHFFNDQARKDRDSWLAGVLGVK
jgi:pimeloyl-ACP methyl ester carboxylesterase